MSPESLRIQPLRYVVEQDYLLFPRVAGLTVVAPVARIAQKLQDGPDNEEKDV